MKIRPCTEHDHDQLLALTIQAFGPFYEQSFPELVPDKLLVAHQHGTWKADYERDLPHLLDPAGTGHALVAVEDAGLLGYLIWRDDDTRANHAHIEILAVSPTCRRQGVAEALMNSAMDQMRGAGRHFVEVSTGGDWFHAPARRLYERLGFHAVPVVAYLRRI